MDSVQLSVAKPLANNDALLKLLQETLGDAEKHEKYILKNDYNQTTKRLVTNIRSNLEDGIKLCIQEQYEPFHVVLSRVKSDFELEKEFYLQRDAEHTQKVTRLEIHIKKLNADIERLHAEIDRLKKENSDIREINSKILQENQQILAQSHTIMEENRQISVENSKIRNDLTQLKHSAARRQVALNIEHEIKKELFTALGLEQNRSALRGTPLFKLRAKFQKQGKRLPKVLNGSLDLNAHEEWDRFDSIMDHMKEFSRNGAHPVTLDDEPISHQKAIELLEEPFTPSALADCLPWTDELKSQAKQMIYNLQAYREANEKFIKTL